MTSSFSTKSSLIAISIALVSLQLNATRLAEVDTALEHGSCSSTLNKHKHRDTSGIEDETPMDKVIAGLMKAQAPYITSNPDVDNPDSERPTVAGFAVDEVEYLAKLAELCYVQPDIDDPVSTGGAKHSRRKGDIVDLIKDGNIQDVHFFGSDANHNKNENMGMVIVETNGNVRVCYHGSDAAQNWKDDFKLSYSIDPATSARVHTGFMEHFYYSKYRVLEILENIARKRGQSLAELSSDTTFVGHSLGASVATYAGYAFAKEFGMTQSSVAAFAPCRSMDATTAFNYDQILGARTLSMMQPWDPVTYGHFATIFGSAHVGNKVYVDQPTYSPSSWHIMDSYIQTIEQWNKDDDLAKQKFYAQSNYSYNPLVAAGKAIPWARRQVNYYVENPLGKALDYAGWKSTPTAVTDGAKVEYDERKERKRGKQLKGDAEKQKKKAAKGSKSEFLTGTSVSASNFIGTPREYIQMELDKALEQALLASIAGPKKKKTLKQKVTGLLKRNKNNSKTSESVKTQVAATETPEIVVNTAKSGKPSMPHHEAVKPLIAVTENTVAAAAA